MNASLANCLSCYYGGPVDNANGCDNATNILSFLPVVLAWIVLLLKGMVAWTMAYCCNLILRRLAPVSPVLHAVMDLLLNVTLSVIVIACLVLAVALLLGLGVFCMIIAIIYYVLVLIIATSIALALAAALFTIEVTLFAIEATLCITGAIVQVTAFLVLFAFGLVRVRDLPPVFFGYEASSRLL